VLGAAGVTGWMVLNKEEPTPAQASAGSSATDVEVMPPSHHVATEPTPVVAVDAAVAAAEEPVGSATGSDVAVAAEDPKKHEPAKPPTHRPITHEHEHEQHEAVATAPAGPPGLITIDSKPVYATIYIDGKNYGDTPLVQIKVPPGHHAVKAVSSSGSTRTATISIESGKIAPTLRIEW